MRSIELDIRFDEGRVRVKRATGASERRTVNMMETMLRSMWEMQKYRPLVLELARNKRNIIDVFAAYAVGKLDGLSAATDDPEVAGLKDAWLAEFEASDAHKRRIRQALDTLLTHQRRTAHVSDLVSILGVYRSHCVTVATPRAFNYARSACLSLLRDKYGKRHALYLDVRDVRTMKEVRKGTSGLTVKEARAVRAKLLALPETRKGAAAAHAWWALCVTGMNPKEYFEDGFEVLSDRILIHGRKRGGRERFVPLVASIDKPELSLAQFGKLVRLAGTVPYAGRKTYARLLEDAQIPRTRREIYRGHATKDIGDVYERYEVDAFLKEDQARLLTSLGTEPTLTIMRTHGLVVQREAVAR